MIFMPKKSFIFLSVVFILLVSCGIFKKEYKNSAELVNYYKDYRLVGRFGNHWPAKVVREMDAKDEITFTLADGMKHSYTKFDGYKLKVVFLVDKAGQETVVVMRSKNNSGNNSKDDNDSDSLLVK